jgi:hypothetical protein
MNQQKIIASCKACDTNISYDCPQSGGYIGPTIYCGKCGNAILVSTMTLFTAWSTTPGGYSITSGPSCGVTWTGTATISPNNSNFFILSTPEPKK